jgi:hypothetical protein
VEDASFSVAWIQKSRGSGALTSKLCRPTTELMPSCAGPVGEFGTAAVTKRRSGSHSQCRFSRRHPAHCPSEPSHFFFLRRQVRHPLRSRVWPDSLATLCWRGRWTAAGSCISRGPCDVGRSPRARQNGIGRKGSWNPRFSPRHKRQKLYSLRAFFAAARSDPADECCFCRWNSFGSCSVSYRHGRSLGTHHLVCGYQAMESYDPG